MKTKRIGEKIKQKLIYGIEEMDKEDYENFIYGRDKEELEELEENGYTNNGDPDYVYNPDGELVCIFEQFYHKYIFIEYCEDDKALEAIEKFMNKEAEEIKYLDDDWNRENIKKQKDDNCYTVAYRGGAGYCYGGGVYKID